MNNIYKEIDKKLEMYKLTKVQKAMFYQQLQDVIEQIEEDKIDEEFLDELINDVFTYNDVEKILIKKRSNLKSSNIFWGSLFLLTSILIIFTNLDIMQMITIILIPLTIYLFIKKWFFFGLLTAYLVLSNFIKVGDISIMIGLIIAYIGFKILFASKRSKVKYHKFENSQNYKDHVSQKYNHYYNPEPNLNDNVENEVLFINNNFNGTNINLINEHINYLNLQNKCGGVEIDLKSFEFPKGDLIININNSFGGAVFYINDNIEVRVAVDSKFGGVSSEHKYETMDNIKHKVYIQGKNVCGGIDVK